MAGRVLRGKGRGLLIDTSRPAYIRHTARDLIARDFARAKLIAGRRFRALRGSEPPSPRSLSEPEIGIFDFFTEPTRSGSLPSNTNLKCFISRAAT